MKRRKLLRQRQVRPDLLARRLDLPGVGGRPTATRLAGSPGSSRSSTKSTTDAISSDRPQNGQADEGHRKECAGFLSSLRPYREQRLSAIRRQKMKPPFRAGQIAGVIPRSS